LREINAFRAVEQRAEKQRASFASLAEIKERYRLAIAARLAAGIFERSILDVYPNA